MTLATSRIGRATEVVGPSTLTRVRASGARHRATAVATTSRVARTTRTLTMISTTDTAHHLLPREIMRDIDRVGRTPPARAARIAIS